VGLFSRLHQFHRHLWRNPPLKTARSKTSLGLRICRFEHMESRQFLSATPIQIGSVYFEDATEDDRLGDTIQITWSGGATGTQLTDLIIDTDKTGDGLTIGDCLFDTAAGGQGAFGYQPLQIVSQNGIDKVEFSVIDGGTKLAFHFTGFDAGERFVFSIDVDEMGFLGANAVAEGNEWEGTKMSATFAAAHYAEASGSDIYVDFYDAKLAASGLSLPPDDYVPPGTSPAPVFTAGAVFSLQQTPLPITLSGTVFEDRNGNNAQESGDPGIGGVSLTLYTLQGAQYVATSFTTTTDANGHYAFNGLEPGTYRVAETQPSGYLSIGAKAGTVDGQTRGLVTDVDTLSDITLEGGDDSLRNDFAEARPASLSGYVYVDGNNNGVKDSAEAPIAGVKLSLLDADGNPAGVTVTTDANGYYSFTGLKPGTYGVTEVQPDGYYDGLDAAGTAGGTAHNPGDSITGAVLVSGTQGLHYDFGELRPASLSGHVYADDNMNGVKDSGETPIAGVKLALLDADGNPTGATTTTDASGFYSFTNLKPGTYGVSETQPVDYFDGLDAAGTAGGTAHNPGDSITGAVLASGTQGLHYDFGEIRPARISGRVYYDLNNNGVFETNETPLAGVTVYLLDASGNRIATTTTSADGSYRFEKLEPGTYGVEEVQPAAYLDGIDSPGTAGGSLAGNDKITQIKLTPGTNAEKYDFGEVLAAKISGYVFVDLPVVTYQEGTEPPDELELLRTHDGVLRPEDERLSGVVLRLADANGVEVLDDEGQPITAVTDENGYYEFTNLRPGVYCIIQEQPDGYVEGVNTAGSEGGTAVNALVIYENPDVVIGYAYDTSNQAIVGITLQAGDDGQNYNFSELLLEAIPDDPHPPITPPQPPAPPSIPPPTQPYAPDRLTTILLLGPGVNIPTLQPLLGGGGSDDDYTWHLSVIDAGQPRDGRDKGDQVASGDDIYYNAVSWNGSELNAGQWILADGQGNETTRYVFGMPGAIPVSGDWNGDGKTEVGIFFDGFWFLDLSGDGRWSKDDLWARLGHSGDQPISGDWDGDGKTDIGIYGPAWRGDPRAIQNEPGLPDVNNRVAGTPQARYKNIPPDPEQATSGWRMLKRTSFGKFRKDLIDHVFQFGDEKCMPVTGDWNGDGVTNIGIFHNGVWYLDADGDGRWSSADIQITMGQQGDTPVVGDWNGDGRTKVGVYRNGRWLLDSNGDGVLDGRDQVFQFGEAADVPVVGDWNGDGVDEIGVYRTGKPATAKQASTQSAPASSSPEPAIKR